MAERKSLPQGITRRRFLQAGGAVTLLVVGGTFWRAVDQGVFSAGKGVAYEPWRDWEGSGPREALNLVRAAILASNAHNTQPWWFRVTETKIEVHADVERHLGTMDPLRREMSLSLGCALENLILAAAANGFKAAVRLMLDRNDSGFVAEVTLAAGEVSRSPLYEAIPHRHTNRAAFDVSRPVGESLLKELSGQVQVPETKLLWFSAATERQRVGELTVKATQAIIADTEMSRDSARWFRFDWNKLQLKQDGITLDAQGLSPVMNTLGKVLPPVSREQGDGIWLAATRDKQVPSAGAYGVIAVSDFANQAQLLEAGRLWQRLHLAVTVQGVAVQPMNQVIERTDREVQLGLSPNFGRELQKLVGAGAGRGVFLFRLGYALEPGLPSPRRAVGKTLR